MLGLFERRHAAIFKDAPRPCVISGQRVDDVAIKSIELGREIARATLNLQIRTVVICWIDAEIAGGSGHDLGQAEGSNG